jgi:single-stranded-DNA-specific exonuclease
MMRPMHGSVLERGVVGRWRMDPPTEAEAAPRLAASLGVPVIVAELLLRRGLSDHDAAAAFLKPKLTDLHDPAKLPGATDAAAHLAEAVRDSRPIVIYGDYDVDGITAAAVLWHTLRAADAQVSTYVPHRLDEGYGLNAEAIDQIGEQAVAEHGKPPLVITVDCGITAVDVAAHAKARGLDLIITDHHHVHAEALPDAAALVHPSLPGSDYPNGDLCGAGVAFKLAWQFAKAWCGSEKVSDTFKALLIDLLSLVALGTVADVVPLTGENRALVVHGLSRIKHTRFLGLNALIDAANLRAETIDAYHVGFVLGPRLNACGRMGHARDAVRLLTDAPPDEARELATFLTNENDRRRTTERRIFTQACELIEQRGDDAEDRRAIVVAAEGWHAGVVGIVASRLVERFGRPSVVLAVNNGSAQGSARSIDGVSIHDAIHTCAAHLDRFGGHAMAAGLTLRTDAIDAFREGLIDAVNRVTTPDDLHGLITIDGELTLRDCTLETFQHIHRLAPFGRANPSPRLLLRGVTLQRPAQPMGSEGKHLALHLRDPGDPTGPVVRAAAFGLGEQIDALATGMTLDVVFKPAINTWRGITRPDLHVIDWRAG